MELFVLLLALGFLAFSLWANRRKVGIGKNSVNLRPRMTAQEHERQLWKESADDGNDNTVTSSFQEWTHFKVGDATNESIIRDSNRYYT